MGIDRMMSGVLVVYSGFSFRFLSVCSRLRFLECSLKGSLLLVVPVPSWFSDDFCGYSLDCFPMSLPLVFYDSCSLGSPLVHLIERKFLVSSIRVVIEGLLQGEGCDWAHFVLFSSVVFGR